MLALSVALVGPYFVDWTSYRADFEREMGRILGREVKVQGTASARLLPFPSVTFTNVSVAGFKPGEPAMTVETFSMDAELAPFLRGDVHIFDMRLVRPSMLVDIADDGALDWAVRPSVPVNAHHVSLEKLTVSEGKVVIRHASSGRTHILTEVNADASARSLAGPWRVDGSVRLDGMRTALSIVTGALDDQSGIRLRVRAQPERYPLALESDGNARLEDGRARYSGSFRLNSIAPQEEAEKDARPAYRVEGAFDFDHTALRVEKFRFETGPLDDPYVAEGGAELALGPDPRFFIRADGAQVRFDAILPDAGEAIGLNQRVAALREFLQDMPRPAIPGRVEVALPAVVAGDTTIRDVHLSAEPNDGGWSIDSLGATLPGRTTLEAKGAVSLEDKFAFNGSLLLAVSQPSGFAAWVAKDVDDAIRRLPAAGFRADVALEAERQTFTNLELMLGSARFEGDIASLTPADARPSMALNLRGGDLDVEGMTAFASMFINDSGEARLADRDLEFDITAGPVRAAGLAAETIDTALRLKEGALEIDRLSIGGLAGANVSATGSIRDIGREPVGTLDATVMASDLAPLLSTLSERFPESLLAKGISSRAQAYPGLLEDASIHVLANSSATGGQPLALDLDVNGEAGGTTFVLRAALTDVERGLAGTPLSMDVTAKAEDAAALYALTGVPALPLGMTGGTDMRLQFDGSLGYGGHARFSLAGQDMSASFEGSALLDGGVLSVDGAARLDSSDLEPWIATAGIGVPGFGTGMPATLAAELDSDGTLLVLSGLSGSLAGAKITGDLNMQMRDGIPHVTGAMSLSTFDLALPAELAFGPDAFVGTGEAWPTFPFASSVAMPVTTDVELVVDTLMAGTFATATNAQLAMRLTRNGMSLSGISAQMRGGTLSGLVDIRNDDGSANVSAQLQLSGAQAGAVLNEPALGGLLDVSAAVTAGGKTVDSLVAALGGSGTVSVRDLAVDGINPGALPELLRMADGLGTEIDAAAIDRFADELVRGGTFGTERVDLAFTLANGVVRTPPVHIETPQAFLAADLRADINDGKVAADALLTYAAGAEALVGSEPAVRFTAAGQPGSLDVNVDTGPLAQFLTQRALEAEQRRVEAMQGLLLERQRHRREVRYYAALADERARAEDKRQRAAEEAERLEREQKQFEEDAERRRLEEEAERERTDVDAQRRAAQEVQDAAQRAAQAEEDERIRQAEQTRLADEERLRAEDERLRAEVEELLRSRVGPIDTTIQPAPAGSLPAAIGNESPQTPAALEVVPTPRPEPSPAPQQRLSVPVDSTDGFMRMLLGEEN